MSELRDLIKKLPTYDGFGGHFNHDAVFFKCEDVLAAIEAASPSPVSAPSEFEDELHTGDDDLLDALTGIRGGVEDADEAIVDGDVAAARESLAGVLEELDAADKLRVAELKASPAPSPVSAWQPISSAPKDGTRILALSVDGDTVVIVGWEAGYSDKTIQRWEDSGGFERRVTHWQLLPPVPLSGERE